MVNGLGFLALVGIFILGVPQCLSAQEGDSKAIYSEINAAWQADFLPDCKAAKSAGFPFDPSSENDVSLGAFAGVFGPNGLFDRFFSENLAEHVDSSSYPWKIREDIGISAETLAQFEVAAFIRDNWFYADGSLRVFVYDVEMEVAMSSISAINLNMDGQVQRWTHDIQPTPYRFTWPGSEDSSLFEIEPPIGGQINSVTEAGVWSTFRLLENFEVRPTDRLDSVRVLADLGGRLTIFKLKAISSYNIFGRNVFPMIECPDTP